MRRRVLILDSSRSYRDNLARIVRSCGNVIVYECSNRQEAYACAMDNEIDLFILDVILDYDAEEDFSGIAFAKHIRENVRYFSTDIIFITNVPDLEKRLLHEVHCYDCLHKSTVKSSHIWNLVSNLLAQLRFQKKNREMIVFRNEGMSYPLYVDQIIYVKIQNRILNVYIMDGVLEVPNLSVKGFLDRVQDNDFLQPMKGSAVNLEYIKFVDFTNRMLQVKGLEHDLEIGSRLKDSFRKEYNNYCGIREQS